MRSPTGAQPLAVRRFGDDAAGGVVVTGDHVLTVPLDHQNPGQGGTVDVYAREVRAAERVDDEQPYLVFLQGGPGGRSPRPGVDGPSWLAWALERYRVILLDQRGTGRSSPQDRYTLAHEGSGMRVEEAAHRLTFFRADAIVDDAEALRRHLLGDVPWASLGQSFGGFCTWTYLSRAPEGLSHAYVTGGIPPLGVPVDDVYRATTRDVQRRVAALDAAHPGVRITLGDVARHVERTQEHLPSGERLTPERLQSVGHILGMANGIDTLAHLADDAWALPGERLSDTFLLGVQRIVSFAEAPLYALVHEACYADPAPGAAASPLGPVVTSWSAQRVRDAQGPGVGCGPGEALPLTGEMVYPHDVARDPALASLVEIADLVAAHAWDRPLYDPARLAANTVPVAACLYTQDMYVDAGLSRATAARTRAVVVVEDDLHHHDGLRRAGADVLDGLERALVDRASGDRAGS